MAGMILTGLYATIVRFGKGLGAATNLSDSFPWGIWIGFDILCGVALAAGGSRPGRLRLPPEHRDPGYHPDRVLGL